MSDSKTNKDHKIDQQPSKDGQIKVPLSHELEVKDLVSPITISRMRILQFSILALVVVVGCSYYYNYYIKSPSGTELLSTWIDAAGGEEAWGQIQTGSFERAHTLYDNNGDVLKEKIETFFFEKADGEFKLLTNFTTPEGINLWMGQDQEGYWATLNDAPAAPKKAGKDLGFMCDSKWCQPDCSMKMTMYRFGMPFNLTSDGIIPSLFGTTEINGVQSNILEISYRPTIGRDRWVFYAGEDDNLIDKIEYHHKTDDGNNLPEEMYWSDYQEVEGLKIPHSWKRFWTNGKVLEEYKFSNFSFNQELPEEFTVRPKNLDWASVL